MRKTICFLGALLLCSNFLFAQSPTRLTIKGIICDTAGVSIPSATIQLLSAKDSTLVSFTQANETGSFEIRNVKNSEYLLMVSHISYMPYQRFLTVSEKDLFDFGKIKLKLISKQLMEVVIKAARAPLKFKGDTVEYDATTFKVPPGSTVEDLLRRLPGIDVDADGNIKSQGRDVTRVYVEGKSFFGDDPKSATKNLGAETISKVQVYDEKSEQSKLTGIADGAKNDKAMNLSLKDEFKKGAFGKLSVAAGDQQRWASRGSYNRFNKTQQLSFIGFGNNINQTGVNWDDISEFRGQNSSNYDNGDFGFGRVYYYGNDDIGNSFDGRGFTKNYGAGVNYNFDNTKTKLSTSYVYNQTTRTLDQTSKKETFLESSSFNNADTTHGVDFRGLHSFGLRLEQNIDSTNVLIAKANVKYSSSTNNNTLNSVYTDDANTLTRTLKTVDDMNNDTWNINSAAIFRHRFKKKGNNLAWSGGFNSTKNNGLDNPLSLNKFFEANTYTEQMILLSSNNNNSATQFKSSMLLTETLSKIFHWEAFYNFSATKNIQDRTTDNALLQDIKVDSLSAYFTNTVLYNRIGTSFRYSNKGMNASLGIAIQQLQLKGNNASQTALPDFQSMINKTYSNLIPDISVEYDITKSSWLSAHYLFGVSEPTIDQLMPVTNVNNLAYRIEGNPDLQPQRSHTFDMTLYFSKGASLATFYTGISYQLFENQIVYNQTILMVENVGMQTVSKPENVKGGDNYSVYSQLGFPIIKTKLTTYIYGNFSNSSSPTYINDVENITKNKSYSINTSINITTSPKLILWIYGRASFNNITYSFRKDLNQKVSTFTVNYSTKWQFAPKTYLESNLDYSEYKNETFGFNQNIPLLNASVRQLFGKTNKIEMRFAVFDIFNRNLNIQQGGTLNYFSQTKANTLARYFMITFSYNIKGFDTKNH
jgi:hypothetical protein